MLAFRPCNKFKELENCYFVGGGTHRGSGLLIILESARIKTNSILQADKQLLFHVNTLPDELHYDVGQVTVQYR